MDIKSILKAAGNDYAAVAADGVEAGDILGFIDTGAYSLNAVISGSIYGGWPIGKVSMLAGDPSAGKTFSLLTTCKVFLDNDPDNVVVYFESESAISKDMLVGRGIDVKRFILMPVTTVQEFRTQAIKILDHYIENREKGKAKLLIGLDSLGMLSTSKEMEDTATGSETRDLTRPAIVKSAFRVITLKLGRAQVPLIVTNHTYSCLTAGHNIRTSNGIVAIEDIKSGDIVLTSSGLEEVQFVCSYDNAKTIKIELEDGIIIECTPNHKFFNKETQAWVLAEEIRIGMDIAEYGDDIVL